MPRNSLGWQAYELATKLWPLNRSLISSATAETLRAVTAGCGGELTVHSYKSGSEVGDWTIPMAWEVRDAYISDGSGHKIVDWKENNLHLMSYSVPVNQVVTRKELFSHLHSEPDTPEWIPYRTSYYENDWGFCIAHNKLETFVDEEYLVVINSKFDDGNLEVGELHFPGKTSAQIVFSTYICHPSMANNELSGPVVLNALAKYLSQRDHYYSYTFLFLPETIGAVAYLSRKLEELRKNVVAGYVVTCVGDDRSWGFIPSRTGITLADNVAKRTLNSANLKYETYSFLQRGSDERQFCSPAVDLPFASVTRSKYGSYPEYHTSGDNLDLISSKALDESIDFFIALIGEFENNRIPIAEKIGEPMYSKYGLRSGPGASTLPQADVDISNIVALSDGSIDMYDLGLALSLTKSDLDEITNLLLSKNIIRFR
jgi:aminopeptidase-like protein